MKRLMVLFALLGGLLVLGTYVWQTQMPLVTPFWKKSRPNLTAELSHRLTSPVDFDYTVAKRLETLDGQLKYLVIESESGRVLAANESEALISPASFTKLLTAMVALDVATTSAQLEATDDSVNKEPTVLGLKKGEKLTIEELILASIATSANDAAATLAGGVAKLYQQPSGFFVELMNQKVALMGLKHSHFANPEGYDHEQQFSTLEDIARLVLGVLDSYPEITAAGAADRQDLEANSNHGHYYLPNWNGLLGVYPGVTGLKIAYTEVAGYSTVVTAKRAGKQVVVLLAGAESVLERDMTAIKLLDAGFVELGVKSAQVSESSLKARYQAWADLASKIRAELKEIESKP